LYTKLNGYKRAYLKFENCKFEYCNFNVTAGKEK
jgi:hypothetical protein